MYRFTVNSTITIFERQAIPYQALGLQNNDPLLESLDRLNQNAGKELIRLERKELRALQYVGVISSGRAHDSNLAENRL